MSSITTTIGVVIVLMNAPRGAYTWKHNVFKLTQAVRISMLLRGC